LYAISALEKVEACYALKGKGSKSGQPVKGVAEVNSLRSGKPECWNRYYIKCFLEASQSIVATIKGYVA